MKDTAARMPLIDALKAVAALLIVMNHYASYGPLAEAARAAFPAIFGGFYEYGRMAVQVFLVIAGFLAAKGLSPNGEALMLSPLPMLWKRYLRLTIPFMAAVGLAIIAAALADHWMDDEAIPARATFGQWLAHALLLHGLLGVDALSAGVWYIAIDFQLFALMALLLWSGRWPRLAPALVLGMGIASLFAFNRDAELDNWAIYFFGSYALGAAAWWASDRRHLSAWLGVIATVAIAALVVDFRLRIAIALAIALMLGFGRRSGLLNRWPDAPPLAFLGQISYSVFLVHFPVLLVANGLYTELEFDSTATALIGMALAVAASLAVATLFYRWIESPEATRRIIAMFGWLVDTAWRLGRRIPYFGILFPPQRH